VRATRVLMSSEKNSNIQTDAYSRQTLKHSRVPAEDPAGFIDFRPVPDLSTKVLADMLTIDEIPRVCSNPKVEPLETEVYG
jgi:hypothetical protein